MSAAGPPMSEHNPVVDVVVRCRDEMPHVERTLLALERQVGVVPRVHFVDCRSTDGSREVARALGVQIVDQDPDRYVPGAVLNRALRETRGEVVAFVNADAVPLADDALALLLAPFEDPRVAASYGRQLPRQGARATTRLDHARAFGAGAPPALRRGLFFSMAASAIRRSAWHAMPFDDTLGYSEDVDWTRRAGALGWDVAYVPAARFEHSHDYDLQQSYRRRAGEGAADAAIHRAGSPSILGDLLRPALGALQRDFRAGHFGSRSVAIRTAEAVGYFMGRRRGVR